MVDAFSLKLQRDNRKNALAVDPAKGKNWKKGCIFHRTVEMKQPHTITEPINILKTICFSLPFFSGGLHDWGILLVLSLEFQERKPQPFPTAQPIFTIYFISADKTATVYCNKANLCKRDGWRADLGEKFTRRQFPCIAGLRTEPVRLFFAHRQLRQQGFDNVKSLWRGRDGVWGREGEAFLQKSSPPPPPPFP